MKTESTIFREVERATVALTARGGQGVLVRGNLIVTAAHCVAHTLTGGMVLGDHYIEDIKTKAGVNLKVSPWAVEPLSDIAALGSLDAQENATETKAFEDFCEQTNPVPVFTGNLAARKSMKVYVYRHTGKWVEGKATRYNLKNIHMFKLETDEPIESGTSGSPIINEEGELVGIVSNSGTGNNGIAPCPLLTLPTWVCRQIESV